MSDAQLGHFPLLDDEIIAELREVMEEEFTDLISAFLDDLPGWLDGLQAAVAQNAAPDLYRIAHKLKSGCGSLGAMQLAELVRQLERAGRQNALDRTVALLAETRRLAQTTTARFSAELDRIG